MPQDLTRFVSGVQELPGFGTNSGFVVRGFFANYEILRNGVRGENPGDLSNIERIEVLKGPISSLYGGTGAFAGNINVITKRPLEKFEAEVIAYAGSEDFYRIEGDVGGPLTGDSSVRFRLNGAVESAGSFDDLAALAPNIWVMALARLIPALGLPVFWALASETAVDIVGPDYAGRAIAKIGFGIVCATVFGIPVGTLISDAFGWRSAFAILAVIALAKALLLFIYLPKTDLHHQQVSLRSQFKILRSPLMQGHVLLSILVFSGMFTAYTYLADILERLAGFNGTVVGWCLMAFGAVGLIGNSLGGRAVDRHPLGASVLFCAFMIAGMVSLVPNIHSPLGQAVAMGIWGITQAALFLVSHVRLMKAAPHAPAFAASLNIAGANLGIGLGAMVGGRVIDSVGLQGFQQFLKQVPAAKIFDDQFVFGV